MGQFSSPFEGPQSLGFLLGWNVRVVGEQGFTSEMPLDLVTKIRRSRSGEVPETGAETQSPVTAPGARNRPTGIPDSRVRSG